MTICHSFNNICASVSVAVKPDQTKHTHMCILLKKAEIIKSLPMLKWYKNKNHP